MDLYFVMMYVLFDNLFIYLTNFMAIGGETYHSCFDIILKFIRYSFIMMKSMIIEDLRFAFQLLLLLKIFVSK